MINLAHMSPTELLSLHSKIGQELRTRKILRSANNPTGDLAEYIFCETFKWEQENNSKKGYDAVDGDVRYQIKARRLDQGKGSRQLSAIRHIELQQFDFLAAVIFNQDYSIWRAAIIPHALVVEEATRVEHNNSYRFLLRDRIWDDLRVQDVTEKLNQVVLK